MQKKMIETAARKGKQGYQYKVGDKVLVLKDLNNTRKSIKSRGKLEKHYLDIPAVITAILHNNRYELQYINGQALPHPKSKDIYSTGHFILYQKGSNDGEPRQKNYN
jgi:hypoxanthine phosphoribosyltransferase